MTEPLTVLGASLTREEALSTCPARRRAAHPHLGGIQQADLPLPPQVGDHIGQRAQPDSALHGAAALGQQWTNLPRPLG